MSLVIDTESSKDNATVKELYSGTAPDVMQVSTISKAQLRALYDDNVPVEGAIIFWEITTAKLNGKVPADWPNATYLDEDGNEVQKTFREYAKYWEGTTKHLIMCGYRDKLGNRIDVVSNDEFRKWVTKFGKTGLLTKSAGIAKLKNTYMPTEEEV